MMNTLPPNLERVVGSFIPWARRDDFIRAFPSQEHVVVRYIARNRHGVSDNALLKHVELPEGLQQVDDHAFEGWSSLTSVTLPQGLREVREYAFSGCTHLTTVTLPEGLQTIGAEAFSGCTGLTSVILPRALKPLADANPYLSRYQYTFI